MATSALTISKLAASAGVNVETVRYYQRRQLLPEPQRPLGGFRHYGQAEWNGHFFSVIDTGGYVQGSDDVFEAEIRKQVALALDEADSILFLVDTQTGVTHMDEAIARMLRKTSKPVLLVANKVDTFDKDGDAAEFYALGLGEVHRISSSQ